MYGRWYCDVDDQYYSEERVYWDSGVDRHFDAHGLDGYVEPDQHFWYDYFHVDGSMPSDGAAGIVYDHGPWDRISQPQPLNRHTDNCHRCANLYCLRLAYDRN